MPAPRMKPGNTTRHADTGRREVGAQALPEAAQAELRGAVDAAPAASRPSRTARRRRAGGRAARGHPLAELARQHDRRPEVDLQGPVELLDAEVEQVTGGGERRVGDERVHVGAGPRELLDRAAVGQVDREGAPAHLRGERLEHVGAAPGEDERGARPVQVAGQRVADPARGAGEQDGAAVEVHVGKTATVAVKP